MRRTVAVAAFLALALATVGACGRSAPGAAIKLDGSGRFPDDQGVVTSVTQQRITLDGRRTYALSPHLQSFAAVSLAVVPVLQTKGQYVQVGLRETTVTWLGRIADVVHTDHDAVFYVGHLVRVQAKDLVMRDGTVLRLADGFTPPTRVDVDVTAEIDPAKHVVVKLT
jgi:hypothetical protein